MPQVTLPNGQVMYNVPEHISKNEIKEVAIQEGLARPEDFEHDFSWAEMAKNAPGSFLDAVKGTAEAVMDLPGTAENLWDIGVGGASNIPGLSGIAEDEQKAKADAIYNHYRQIYTDWDNFKRYAEEDPFGVATDLATVVAPGGAAMKATKLPGIAKAGDIAQKAALAVDPVNLTLNTAKIPITALGRSNFPTNQTQRAFGSERPTAEFMMREKYIPTKNSMEQFKKDRNALNSEMEDIVKGSKTPIDARAVFKELDDYGNNLWGAGYGSTKGYNAWRKKVDEIHSDYIDPVTGQLPTHFTPGQVLDIKRKAQKHYDTLMKQTEKGKKSTPETVMQDKVRRGAKGELEKVDPRIGPLNERLAEYAEAKIPFKKSVKRGQEAAGSLSTDVLLPTGLAYGLGLGIDPMLPSPVASTILPLAALAIGGVNRPVPSAKMARYLDKVGKGGGFGYLDNSTLPFMARKMMETVGNEQAEEYLNAIERQILNR